MPARKAQVVPPLPPPETSAPARNFTIPLADHVRAAAGPPAYSVRKRRMEDLEAALLEALGAESTETEEDRASVALGRSELAESLRELTALVAAHNRYYPIEANLPIDPRTGALVERGRRWEPLPEPSLDALTERARRAKETR